MNRKIQLKEILTNWKKAKYSDENQAVDNLTKDAKLFDAALSSVAAGPITNPIKLETKDGKYIITICPSLDNANKGIITLEIVDKETQKEMEDRVIMIKDGKSRTLLRGQVLKGKVLQEIKDLSNIEIEMLTVGPELSS